jgi:hypothetical protein
MNRLKDIFIVVTIALAVLITLGPVFLVRCLRAGWAGSSEIIDGIFRG